MSQFPSVLALLCCIGCLITPARASFLTCASATSPFEVRGEGLTERQGDVVLNCSDGAPNAQITGNLFVFLSVPVTNRTSASSVTDAALTIDTGAGPQPSGVAGVLMNASSIAFNGITFNLSGTGSIIMRISNIRTNVTSLLGSANPYVTAQLIFNGTPVSLPGAPLTTALVGRGLYDGLSSRIVCSQAGSLLPANAKSFAAFLAANSSFASTRVSEGFPDAFQPLSGPANLNADNGHRIIINYSGFPSGASLFVPDVIAGSDATQPTAGGDFGLAASAGQYTPGNGGSLLLARVRGADANGIGGGIAYTPGTPGSGTVAFDSMGQVTLTNGGGYAVYEVVDANPNVRESAQIPAFLGLPANSVSATVLTSEMVSLAPVSNVTTATATDPIPRFTGSTPPPDCTVVGDCGAAYFPLLSVDTTPLKFTVQAGGSNQAGFVRVHNVGGGVLGWNASVTYANGSGWLQIGPASALNNATILVTAIPGQLAPGTYSASITVDAGPQAGTSIVPVTLTINPAITPQVQLPTITSVWNSATLASSPVVPGSLTTIIGSKLSGQKVAVTFDGVAAQVLYNSDTQINLVVPSGITATISQLVVTVDGVSSAPQSVNVAIAAPAIFKGGVVNQDYSANSASNPAQVGSVVQIYATGLPNSGPIFAKVGNDAINTPYFAGPVPNLPGVQLVLILLPSDISSGIVNVEVCTGRPGVDACSAPMPLDIAAH